MAYTVLMDEKQTTPKGAEIPIPKRGDWDRLLDKAAKPKPESPSDRPPEK